MKKYILSHTNREFIASRPALCMFNFFRQKEYYIRQTHGFTKEMKSAGSEMKEIYIVVIFCVFTA